MSVSRFEKLWDLVVPDIIKMSIEEIDVDFMKSKNVHLCDMNLLKKDIESFYVETKIKLKSQCAKDIKNENLDLHKLAAIFCAGFVRYKPVVYDDSFKEDFEKIEKKYIINNYLINYKIAFYVAAGIVYYDLIERVHEDEVLLKKVMAEGFLVKYPFDEKHTHFENSVIIDLARNDYEEGEFDFFAFATILFQWQQYSLLIAQNKINN